MAQAFVRLQANEKKIVTGAGLGLTLQFPNIAAQTVLADEDVSIGLSVLNFSSFLGGSVFVSVSQTLLQSKLVEGLKPIIPDLDSSMLANGGATSLRSMVSEDKLQSLLDVYNDSMRSIWYLCLGLSCLVFLASFGFEWKSVKEQEKSEDTTSP